MSRRVSLPGADELFRATGGTGAGTGTGAGAKPGGTGNGSGGAGGTSANGNGATDVDGLASGSTGGSSAARARRTPPTRGDHRGPTGRERHDEKITVYVSPAELLDLETARLTLRGSHGLAVDRGRIVREAVAVVLADLDANGDDSVLVRRLRET